MKTVRVNRFDRGKAEDRFSREVGKCAFSKQFDCVTHPNKLQPLRGMATHTASTGIGNFMVAADGLMYGVGTNSGNGRLYVLAGYGASDNFAALSTDQLSGATVVYDLLVDWPEAGNTRKIHWASNNLIVCSNYSGGAGSATTDALTFSSIGQGIVHPKDKILYFPYRTSTTPYIALISSNATPFAGKNYTALTLPIQYRAYCLSYYGNYLAIPLTNASSTSNVSDTLVALWDRDTSNTLFNETIPWGQGSLKVLNNLNGVLIGVSQIAETNFQTGTSQDYNAIQIKAWNGGAEPTVIGEIKSQRISGANSAGSTITIYPRVNFIHNNKLFFSASIDPNDGIQPTRIGLWSVGRSRTTGEWTVQMERVATNDNTETSIIAAQLVGDYLETVHTAAGTLTKSINGITSSTTFGATSVYETLVNPEMSDDDYYKEKSLSGIRVQFEPLPASSSVVIKYRVDSDGDDSDWVTVTTCNTAGDTFCEAVKASGETFTPGVNYEFRFESTGGAVITAYSYAYDPLTTSNVLK